MQKPDQSFSTPEYVAHRGFSEYNPDNTTQSFTAASENEKFYGIETDIRLTTDGVLVCSHDATAVFADGSSRVVEQSTYAELIEKPLKNTKTSDEAYICKFSEYLTICKSGNKIAVTELKDVFTDDMIRQTLEEIDAYYSREKCTVIAFDFDSLCRMRDADPTIELQYLSSKRTDKNIKTCLEQGISVDLHYGIVSRRLIKKFHDKNLKVNVWTVNTPEVQTRMRKYGVDYITSNVLCED